MHEICAKLRSARIHLVVGAKMVDVVIILVSLHT